MEKDLKGLLHYNQFRARNPKSLSINSFGHSFSTADDHRDFGSSREFEVFFDPLGVKALHGAGIVSSRLHTQHKSHAGQGRAFVNRNADGGFTYLPNHRVAEALRDGD